MDGVANPICLMHRLSFDKTRGMRKRFFHTSVVKKSTIARPMLTIAIVINFGEMD